MVKLDRLGIRYLGVKETEHRQDPVLTFHHSDGIQLEFFWRSPTPCAGSALRRLWLVRLPVGSAAHGVRLLDPADE